MITSLYKSLSKATGLYLPEQIDDFAADTAAFQFFVLQSDRVVFGIDGDKVNITVMTTSEGLTQAEVAQIRDIVLSECSVSAQNITVVEIK